MTQHVVSYCDLLLTGGTVVTVDDARAIIDDGAVAITGDRIVAVGPAAALSRLDAGRVVDCHDKVIMPGLVDSHTHLYQGLARTLGEGMLLWSWLSGLMWPYAAQMTTDDARAAARLGAVEAVRSGTTCIVDHHYAPADYDSVLGVASAVESVGLRGAIARGLAGSPSDVVRAHGLTGAIFARSNDEEIAITRACIEARPPGSHVAVWPGPHNITYADQDLVRRAVTLAHDTGTKWHSHCASTVSDPGVYAAAYGTTPVAWLHQERVLSSSATLAHGIHLTDPEVWMLAETATAVAHCPVSNQYGADGTARLRRLRDAGVVVGLGSDGPAYGHRQDLFECMKQAVLVQRASTLDPGASNSHEALDLATREGARLAGVDAGYLAPGKFADIAVLDFARPHLTPCHDVVAALVYAARGSDVVMTIVGGRILYEGGRCTQVDETAVISEARERADAVVRRAGLIAMPVQ